MNYPVYAHLAYLAVSFGVTVWVARTLSITVRVFLIDSFLGNRNLAESSPWLVDGPDLRGSQTF